MFKFRFLNKNIIGILQLLLSHFLVLFSTILISFLLPLMISVEEYGKWQYFSLAIGYCGFFAFGFNDGIHVKYSGLDYDKEYFVKFRSFRLFIELLALFSTVICFMLLFIFYKSFKESILLYFVVICNIIPVLINGFFTYVNQGTKRYKYSAVANSLEKIVFLFIVLGLFIFKVSDAIYYIIAYTFGRYIVILYNCWNCKELFGEPRYSLKCLWPEIKSTFIAGIVLMFAIIFNQSVIVPSQLLIKSNFGLVAFSYYSFAVHTMAIVNSVYIAVSQVFYPEIKSRKISFDFSFYSIIDKTIGIVSVLLLSSYFLVYGLIYFCYNKYTPVLEYLFLIYPTFIFVSKITVLIVNQYKLEQKYSKLIFNNLLGILLNLVFSYIAYSIFKTVFSVACACLATYIVWFYYCYISLLVEKNQIINKYTFFDLYVVILFVVINMYMVATNNTLVERCIIPFSVYTTFVFIYLYFNKNRLKNIFGRLLTNV